MNSCFRSILCSCKTTQSLSLLSITTKVYISLIFAKFLPLACIISCSRITSIDILTIKVLTCARRLHQVQVLLDVACRQCRHHLRKSSVKVAQLTQRNISVTIKGSNTILRPLGISNRFNCSTCRSSAIFFNFTPKSTYASSV